MAGAKYAPSQAVNKAISWSLGRWGGVLTARARHRRSGPPALPEQDERNPLFGSRNTISCCGQQLDLWIMSMTVQFTPGQLRSAASIPPETYRHWKKTLLPLRRDCGHSPCFTSGELVAVAVVRTLCVDLGIRVSGLSQT